MSSFLPSGSAIMQDGATIRNGYPLDLDSLSVGSRIGMMRCSDGTLHYYLDGVDQGVASADIASGENISPCLTDFHHISTHFELKKLLDCS